MKNGKIGVGFIGCGYIAAKKHLPLTAGDRHCEIVSLYSRSRGRAEECQRLFGGLIHALPRPPKNLSPSNALT